MINRIANGFFMLFFSLAGQASAQVSFPRVELAAGVHRVNAEVAFTGPMREQGLMFRRNLPPNYGMLFSFPEQAQHCMWMRNTLIPLSVAFLDEHGHVINVADMLPMSESNHCAARPARYALEMEKGWFAARGIRAGMIIGGIDKAPPPQ